MKFEELFDQRSIVAMKLKDYIRECLTYKIIKDIAEKRKLPSWIIRRFLF